MQEREEGEAIRSILNQRLPKVWYGKDCILFLKNHNYNWKQMEWIGWYFEFAARLVLIETLGGSKGPRFGRTTMDYKRNYVWDFKAHPIKNQGKDEAILNDCEAVNFCIEKHGGIGFVIAIGSATYDNMGEFKNWHDSLKGGISDYEIERIERNAPTRQRKVSFNLTRYEMIFIKNGADLDRALKEGWLSADAQIGWRNADGSRRRAKYKIAFDNIPDWCRI